MLNRNGLSENKDKKKVALPEFLYDLLMGVVLTVQDRIPIKKQEV